MLHDLKVVFGIFSRKEKRQLAVIFFTILISGLTQIFGIISILPFIAVASNPELITTNTHLIALSDYLSLDNQREFLMVLGAGSFLVLVMSNIIVGFNIWLTMRFIARANHGLSYRLLTYYLKQHYLYHLQRNSAELIKNMMIENSRLINGVVMNILNISSKYVNVALIIGMLFLVDPFLVLIAIFTLGGSYLLIYMTVRRKILRIGLHNSELHSERYQLANESLGGIKDLKLLGRTDYYLDRYAIVADDVIQNNIYARTISEMPRYFLETLAFGGILLITLYLVNQGNSSDLMPLLSLYAFAGYRLMPALQAIFQGHTTLRNNIAVVEVLKDELTNYSKYLNTTPSHAASEQSRDSGRLPLVGSIRLENITFAYPDSERSALNGLSLEIETKSSVAFVGASGAGKTTCVDLILGLIEPESGSMLVDGVEISHSNLRQWQNNIGYVPQSIYLADSTIAENIAFGIDKAAIDKDAVVNAAKMASLEEFIENELPDGYQTVVGEHGVRLSGGQRQRIGIARALYHDPDVLVLDEATSALDMPTEQAIMESIHNLSGQKTIIIVAHRISTIRECSKIFRLDNGCLLESGSFEFLLEHSDGFARLASALVPTRTVAGNE
jgi:ABC-type multidrug transport system fused ATPase/permease subunit